MSTKSPSITTSILPDLPTRRAALKRLGLGAIGLGSLATLPRPALAGFAQASAGPATDIAVLKFALNLEYLESEYYSYATSGRGIETFGIGVDGEGTRGTTVVKPNPQVTFTSTAVRDYAMEIAANERAHTAFVRTTIQALGSTPIARPPINLREAFAAAALAAGLPAGFDPFSSETNFLLGAFMLEDVGMSAYRGSAAMLTNKLVIDGSAGIIAVEGYHSAILRVKIYESGPAAQQASQAISDLRDSLDGPQDLDQPVVLNGAANIVPTDANALALGRTPRQVLNIVYQAPNASSGGFFPSGVNGPIR